MTWTIDRLPESARLQDEWILRKDGELILRISKNADHVFIEGEREESAFALGSEAIPLLFQVFQEMPRFGRDHASLDPLAMIRRAVGMAKNDKEGTAGSALFDLIERIETALKIAEQQR